MTLHHFVKLLVISLNNVCTSKTVHAIITPGLCMPVILGLPFLIHNNIVTDHKACSCIDKKKTGYNLLNPAPILPPLPPHMCVKEQIKFMKAAKKLTLDKLKSVCQRCNTFHSPTDSPRNPGGIRGLYSPPTFHREFIWNPYHSRWIPPIPYGICFG